MPISKGIPPMGAEIGVGVKLGLGLGSKYKIL